MSSSIVPIPPEHESSLEYLLLEKKREQFIEQKSPLPVLSDRSVLSTITYIGAESVYSNKLFEPELELLEELIQNKEVVFPKKVIMLDISIEESKFRQEKRDRDVLEGRKWYDSTFLSAFQSINDAMISAVYLTEDVLRINTQENDPVTVREEVLQFIHTNYDN